MKKMILAVSGGVDSMVMLDIFASKFKPEDLIVATFNHGTRKSGKTDADFVTKRAKELGIKVYQGEAKLGEEVSEEKAREKRYEFLRKIAFLERGEIFTAHHLDDLVETITINFLRGTGWRGLAGLSGLGIRRPFLDGFLKPEEFGFKIFDKKAILEYSSKKQIIFREDPTNSHDNYLRNRVRKKTRELDFETKIKIFELWKQQKAIKNEVEKILEAILPENRVYEREWFLNLDEKISLEILHEALIRAKNPMTRPQIMNFLDAIKTYSPKKKFNLANDKLVLINKKDFRI